MNTGFAGDGIVCIAVLPVVCAANERASAGQCVACAAGKTRAAGDVTVETVDADSIELETLCAATICKVDEKVISHTCVACARGFENPLSGDPAVGDDASGDDTACTAVPTTGKCIGNTDANADVACPDGFLSKPDPRTLDGTNVRECCDFAPEDEPEVTYRWQATAWGACSFGCGTRPSLERTVACTELTVYSNGAVARAVAGNATSCTNDRPASVKQCPTLAPGTACDDANALTTGDVCTAAGACAGKQVLKSALTYPVAAEDVALPPANASPDEVTASPIGAAIKASLETSLAGLGAGIVVTILKIQAGSLVVDYKVELPAAAPIVTEETKNAATSAVAEAQIDLPTAAGGTIAAGLPYVEPFKTYAYTRTAGCSAGSECSTACTFAGEVAADVYQCLEDGSPVSAESCVVAGIGAVPTSESTCCPAADPETCEASDAEVTAPPPCPDGNIADSELSTKDKARCAVAALKEKLGAGVIVVIVIVIVAVLLCLVYKQDLEARLAKVREQQQGTLEGQ